MKVFVSWSGARSHVLATALRDWLKLGLHYVEPWLSDADLAAGERWGQALAKELETSNFGVIGVTRDNITSPWILFEAGEVVLVLGDVVVTPKCERLCRDLLSFFLQQSADGVVAVHVSKAVVRISHAPCGVVHECVNLRPLVRVTETRRDSNGSALRRSHALRPLQNAQHGFARGGETSSGSRLSREASQGGYLPPRGFVETAAHALAVGQRLD